ncbi:MAG: type II secretion system F family protein [Amnibacterium sp.]
MLLVPILASLALTGGLAGAVLLAAFRGPRRASVAVGVDPIPAAPRSPGAGFAVLLPPFYRAVLERRFQLAGRPRAWTPGRVAMLKPVLGLVALAIALWWISGGPGPFRIAVGVFTVLLAFFTPDLLLYSRGLERQQAIAVALPDTLDQMTISVEAGLGFESAMAKAATNGSGPLAEELIRTLQDMSIGRTRQAAYEALAARTSSPDLRRFTRAIVQADLYGIAIGDVLRVQAGEMRLKRRQRAEEQAMKVPVKVLFPLMGCILPVLFIIILAPAALTALRTFLG